MKKKLGKLIRKIVPGLFFLPWLESLLRIGGKQSGIPPVFIVGAPRSGSTLLYQFLVSHYQYAYIPNLVSVFYKSPLLIFRLFRKSVSYRQTTFSSDYGFVEGNWAPSEAGKLFEYWFDHHGLSREQIRRTVFSISKLTGAPLLVKNMNNTLRLEKILETFPEAVIIHIRRDSLFNAQSILMARKELKGSYDEWWPRKPFNYNELKKYEAFLQVISYLDTIEIYIREQIDKKTATSYHEISYEEFCGDPAKQTEGWTSAPKKGVSDELHDTEVKRFESNNRPKMPESDFQKLKKLYEDHIRT